VDVWETWEDLVVLITSCCLRKDDAPRVKR